MPKGEENFISVYIIIDEKIALIETGPASSNTNLQNGIEAAGINLKDIDYIIPTHIHLDHFRGGRLIMELCHTAQAVVHPKAYKQVSTIALRW